MSHERPFSSTLLLAAGVLTAFACQQASASCAKPWIFFDVGDTLVNASPDPKNLGHMKDERYVKGALPYLSQLKKKGYTLGLISNIPPTWGDEGEFHQVPDKRTRQLLFAQKSFQQDWKKGEPEFDWSFFGKIKGSGNHRIFEGRIFFPNHISERKPLTCSECILNRGLESAKAAGCQAIYIGESQAEMNAAEKAGFVPFWYRADSQNAKFLPLNRIKDYVAHYHAGDWKESAPQLKAEPLRK
ncbi:MAG: hypothetical protein H7222_08315 [Methylotenera sp.]|nr:hypothetical protein [Oligoflexia bacterium]